MTQRAPLADTALARALLQPDSVALIGVSDDPAKTAGRALRYLRQCGFSGRIYCVNPTHETVQGEPAYARVSELPEVVDHAFILTGTALAMEAVAECGRSGVPLATVLATGFSESGPDGLQREAQLRAIARENGIRILGPSSLGGREHRRTPAVDGECRVRGTELAPRRHFLRIAQRQPDRRTCLARPGPRDRLQ